MIEVDFVYLAVAAMAWVVTLAGVAAWAYSLGYDTSDERWQARVQGPPYEF